ncbi:unnamed protein product [Mytilus edulis]|uniref:PH domain-containing protein n=1 Tax=Mytilus edulis TaxID=6550 RepID=A0A8S3RPH1_MYTED|nr:unnamed protein product [Mytilus edulis]
MNQTRRHRPFANIDCQSLIGLGDNLFGWLRSQNIMNKWTKKFAVLYKGYVYIFKNENATNHYRDMSFPLQGYKSIEQPILKDNEVIWVMKLLHADEVKSRLFATSSEKELNDWADKLEEGITFANNAQIRQSYAVWPQGTTSEPEMYEESRRYQRDVMKKNAAPLERPPMLPPRPQKEPTPLNEYLDLKNPTSESESSSDFGDDNDVDDNDEDDNDDSSEGYCFYQNMGDATYYNDPVETSDLYDECNTRKIELTQGSRYSVISKRPYRAQIGDELNFPKEMKFDVVGQASKRWLIGEINGEKGYFL